MTCEHKKPVCGDSRHDLNCPEFPDSWNNKEKTKMGFIIALAIYGVGVDTLIPIFLLGLVVWYGSFFASGYADADDIYS